MSYESGMLGVELSDYPDALADEVRNMLNIKDRDDAKTFVSEMLACDESSPERRFIEGIRRLGTEEHQMQQSFSCKADAEAWEQENKELFESGAIRKRDDSYFSSGHLSDEALTDVVFDLSRMMRLVAEIENINGTLLEERHKGHKAPAPTRTAYEALGLKLEKVDNAIRASMNMVISEAMLSVLLNVAAVDAVEGDDDNLGFFQRHLSISPSSIRRFQGKYVKDNGLYLPSQKDYVESLDADTEYSVLGVYSWTGLKNDMLSRERIYVDASEDWSDRMLAVNLPNLEVMPQLRRLQIGTKDEYAKLWLSLLDSFNKSRLLRCDYCGEYVEVSSQKRTCACKNCTKTRQRYRKYKEMKEADKAKPKKQRLTEKELSRACGLGLRTITYLEKREKELGRPLD